MDWFKKHWMSLVVGLLVLVVIALLVWAIPNHTEAGLQRVCWQNNSAYYEGEPNLPCVPDMDLVWPQGQLPIDIGVEALNDELRAEGRGTVGRAINLWNSQLGFEAFRLVPLGSDSSATAVVDWGLPIEVGHTRGREGGWVSHRLEPEGRMVADVAIIHIATTRLAYLVTVHELGHLIGLAHDDYESSPMFPTTRDDSTDARLGFTVISGWDKDALRRTYPR